MTGRIYTPTDYIYLHRHLSSSTALSVRLVAEGGYSIERYLATFLFTFLLVNI